MVYVRVTKSGIYIETERYLTRYTLAGAYIETVDKQVRAEAIGAYVETDPIIEIEVYQEGAYAEVEQEVIKLYQEGVYAEVEQKLVNVYQEGAYIELEIVEALPPETMTVAPVAMSKNVPIIFRM